MYFMNESDIDNAAERWQEHPVLGPATQTLSNLRDVVNANSDGWAYWRKPLGAARQLMTLIMGDGTAAYYSGDREDATPEKYRKALGPVKAFRTQMLKRSNDFAFEIVRLAEDVTPADRRQAAKVAVAKAVREREALGELYRRAQAAESEAYRELEAAEAALPARRPARTS
jgi:hypothetical protein